MTEYYFKRIINNPLNLTAIIVVMLLPMIDVFYSLKDVYLGGSVLLPDLASFLAGTIGHGAQTVLLWYLPVYFLIICADDCIEDHKTGCKYILISKLGKKKYLYINIIKGFVIGFTVMFVSLVFNLLIVHVLFNGGTYISAEISSSEKNHLLQNSLLINIIYIIFVSFMTGILSMGASALADAIHNRFLLYPIVFIFWYIASFGDRPIILAFQPFSEYTIQDCLPMITFVLIYNLLFVLFSLIKVLHYDKT